MSRGGGARPSRRSCPEKIYLLKEGKILPSMTKGKMRIKVAEKKDGRWRGGKGNCVGKTGKGQFLVYCRPMTITKYKLESKTYSVREL